ncbi:hypothetical protein [Paracoccus jeotgali]|uniref:hypothetical protein n=1 Tax=Paracoccus jeotgali TaxID=2065379 RepID=UPI001315251F|nr:hypothetical protein [Paracoccus jeotgali]
MKAALRILLILILSLTSQGLAMAHAQPRSESQATICLGSAVLVVTVDAEGQPVQRRVLCSDMAAQLMAAVATDPALPPLLRLGHVLPPELRHSTPRGHVPPRAQARGPPIRLV